MSMKTEIYKFIPVKGKTHNKFKTLAAKKKLTFDQLLQALMEKK